MLQGLYDADTTEHNDNTYYNRTDLNGISKVVERNGVRQKIGAAAWQTAVGCSPAAIISGASGVAGSGNVATVFRTSVSSTIPCGCWSCHGRPNVFSIFRLLRKHRHSAQVKTTGVVVVVVIIIIVIIIIVVVVFIVVILVVVMDNVTRL